MKDNKVDENYNDALYLSKNFIEEIDSVLEKFNDDDLRSGLNSFHSLETGMIFSFLYCKHENNYVSLNEIIKYRLKNNQPPTKDFQLLMYIADAKEFLSVYDFKSAEGELLNLKQLMRKIIQPEGI